MKIYKREAWGVSLWDGARQIGAAPGMTLAVVLGRALSVTEARMWRKRGIVPMSM